MAVVTFSNIKGTGGGGGTLTGITFLNSDYTLEFIESAVTSAITEEMSAYTPTSGFATINGSAITEGGNLEIEGATYSAGTNINIDEDNVISVTGITVPTNLSDLNNDEGFVDSGDVQTQIDNSISGKADSSALTSYATTAFTEETYMKKGEMPDMSAYTPTSGFSTINGSAITDGSNIVVEETPYSGGTNIDITDHVISVTGITVPTNVSDLNDDIGIATTAWTNSAITDATSGLATEQYVDNSVSGKADTSGVTASIAAATAATTGWVENQGYLTAYTETDPVFMASAASGITSNDISNWNDKLDASALTQYYTSAQTDTAISNATSGLVTSADVETQITDKGYITGYTETDPIFQASAASGITSQDITNWNGKLDASALTPYYTSAQTDTAISNATSGLQETLVSGTNIKTINNESLLGSGNINIQGGSGGTNIIELTQAEYDALTSYTQDAVYVITDAQEINLSEFITTANTDYWTSAETQSAITESTSGKADAASVSANGNYGYFPYWNSQGVITGFDSTRAFVRNFSVNVSTKSMVQATNSDLPSIYAPTSAGTQNQVLLSNGSGAPVWSSFKFAFMTQAEYDLITPDSSTIYFITD